MDRPVDSNVLLWITVAAVLLLMLIYAAIKIILIRRKFKSDSSDQDPAASPFTLDQVRQMHRRGQVSDEEFQRLKDKILKETHFDSSDT